MHFWSEFMFLLLILDFGAFIDKISDAANKGANTIVLYFHDESVFDRQRIVNAYRGYLKLYIPQGCNAR